MSKFIHSSAVVDSGARLGKGVEIGPYCWVGPKVELADLVLLISHVTVSGRTKIGPRSVIYPFASLGHPPQDLKYKGEDSLLEIGSENRIREHVTMSPGTQGGGMVTLVGDRNLFMAGSHVAHDCRIGDDVVLANSVHLGGHVSVENCAVLGGLSAIQQRVRIGHHAMVGGMSGVERDVIPFGVVTGNRARLSGINLIGLERRGFSREDIRVLRAAYRMLFAPEGTLAERLEEVERAYGGHKLVHQITDFIARRADRPICQPADGNAF